MSNIDKHAVQAVADLKAGYTLGHADVAILNELARIALASLEAGPVAWAHRLINKRNGVVHPWVYGSAETSPSEGDIFNIEVMPLYTAPPAPVSVPDAMEMDDDFDSAFEHGKAVGWNACRAAMLQGAEPVSQPYTLPDGYCIMPMKLTAENGAKCALAGEFSETKFISCPECFGDDECETCDGTGRIEISVPVSWTTIKDIWAKGVEHFAEAAPQQEVK
ncbi:TPA: hypothetical protein ACN5PU_001995 [Enterobacter hormaechei]|uniref:hypothetical protein n=1 Tax=Enterobacter hormaechei TaxID=158836 RepID=UPI000F827FBA|nr:hypothetical protein [Enterobacter hormaechei]MCM8053886.1 hypothetical protein [Enterobacter hormaechei]MCM8220240.1 hypothetical protein [Enterobacter hormaechei]MCW4843739.1 hypothetical protein [Enterobacter hormaechei subsp. xiangfangensis]MCW4955154.1 hypothetical protein [Enterobacter hormaechei subsp. xiangfangensis]MDA4690158.1 hypothetical protein [Enterobacter hormaechei]